MDDEGRVRDIEPEALLGQVVAGKFRLDRCIGRTLDSLVFRARQLNLQRDVAVKILLADPGGVWQLGARLRQEARIIAALHHPGLAEIYDEGVTPEGLPFIVMEYLRGETLSQYLASKGHLDAAEAVNIVRTVASVLEAVHAAGFVHRDLKPGNIFVEPDGSNQAIKLIDFGAIRRLGENEDGAPHSDTMRGLGEGGLKPPTLIRTMPGVVIGTPDYMSPEQCRAAPLDERSDIYSLGIVLYELLVGMPPFRAKTPTGVMAAHIAWSPPPFSEHDVVVPAELERAVMRALDKAPERRFSTMSEFSRELASSVAPSSAPPPVWGSSPAVDTVRKDAATSFAAYAYAFLGFLVFATLGTLAFLRTRDSESARTRGPGSAAADGSGSSANPDRNGPTNAMALPIATTETPSATAFDTSTAELPAPSAPAPEVSVAAARTAPSARSIARPPPVSVRANYRLDELKTPAVHDGNQKAPR